MVLARSAFGFLRAQVMPYNLMNDLLVVDLLEAAVLVMIMVVAVVALLVGVTIDLPLTKDILSIVAMIHGTRAEVTHGRRRVLLARPLGATGLLNRVCSP